MESVSHRGKIVQVTPEFTTVEIISSSRNDDIYRSIFGMSEIPDELRHSGIGGLSRYDYLADAQPGSPLRSTAVRLDHLTKESYVQSKSFDEVATLSRRAGDMASCIPAIPPFSPEKGKYTRPTTRVLSLRQEVLNWSVLKEVSCVAFQTRKAPMGTSTYRGIRAPEAGEMAPSLASFDPVRSTTQ